MLRIYEFIILFVVVVLLQVLLFENLQISSYINIYMYIVALLLLPTRTSGAVTLIYGALLGFSVDFMIGMPGINSISTIFIAFIRPLLLKLFVSHDLINDDIVPTASRVGVSSFILYSSSAIILNNMIIFYLDSVGIYSIDGVFLKFGVSTLITIFVVFLCQLPLFPPRVSKR